MFVDAEITARTQWAEGLWTMRLDAEVASFEPGQFVNLALPVDGELVKRAYSIASAPSCPLELYLVRVDGGVLTPRLDAMTIGDVVKVDTRANGFFTLRHVPQGRDAWLLSTGTGLGPFISMLRSGQLWSRFENVVLVNGARRLAHLGYRDELETLQRTQPSFRYVPMVTREHHEDIIRSRIPAAVRAGVLDQIAGRQLDADHAQVMLCGNPDMIRDSIEALAERGLRKHRRAKPGHITVEKYW